MEQLYVNSDAFGDAAADTMENWYRYAEGPGRSMFMAWYEEECDEDEKPVTFDEWLSDVFAAELSPVEDDDKYERLF